LSVVIVAFNEAEGIRRRLENLLALDYTPERVEIVLASDGSTDGTMNLARSYEGVGVTVIPFATRRGKAAVLNDVLPKVGGEIVVLADARQRFQAGALRALVKPFADQRVGAVSGELVLASTEGDTGVGEGVGFYWRYEKFIRKNESLVDSTVGATGAIYAIRRELFEPIPQDTILDDVLIPMRIARRGYRVVFEPTALAYDKTAATAREEFTRKVRTIAGNFQLFAREPWLLHPLRNRLWLQAVSHKGLRLITPILLLATMGANLLLLGHSFYRWTLMGQAFFYGAALGGYALREVGSKVPLLGVPYVLCLMNWATVVAFIRFIRGRQRATWEKAV
jgi:cellulose synthase/poly-beta-1,6-N-acetylglucosamine synthase-like glycosyltransferase